LQLTKQDPKRVQTMVDALVTLGRGDGWGNTNATVSALKALSDFLTASSSSADARQHVSVLLDGKSQNLEVGGETRIINLYGVQADAARVTVLDKDKSPAQQPVSMRVESRYLPKADGSQIAPQARGFALQREWLKLIDSDKPLQRLAIDQAGQQLKLNVGDIIEEHVEVVNAENSTYVAIAVPIAAGMEPMNPNLATAPAEAKPRGAITLTPTYADYADDQVVFYYDSLPMGNYHFYFRTRASIKGNYIQPPAYAELMYHEAVNGNSAGARVIIDAAVTTSNDEPSPDK